MTYCNYTCTLFYAEVDSTNAEGIVMASWTTVLLWTAVLSLFTS